MDEDKEYWKRQAESAQWTLYYVLKEAGPVTIKKSTVEEGAPPDAAVLDEKTIEGNLLLWAGRDSERFDND